MDGSRDEAQARTTNAAGAISRRVALHRLGAGGLAAALLARGLEPATAQQATPGTTGNYMAIRQYQLVPGASMDEVVGIVVAGFVPIVTQVPGFVEYFFLDAGKALASISIFTDLAGAEESARRVADWVAQNLAQFFQGPPTVVAGSVHINEEAG